MSINYLSGITELEEGSSYKLNWYVPDYAGQKLFIGSYEHYYNDNHADPWSDYNVRPRGGFGGTEAATRIDSNGNASFTVNIKLDKKIDPNEFFVLHFFAGKNLYEAYEYDEEIGTKRFNIIDKYRDVDWEFQFYGSRSGGAERPASYITDEILEGEVIWDKGTKGRNVYLSVLTKKGYPPGQEIYYKVYRNTGSKSKLYGKGSYYFSKQGKSPILEIDIRDKDEKDNTYTAYFYRDRKYKYQIGNTPSIVIKDYSSHFKDLSNFGINEERHLDHSSRYYIYVGAGNGRNVGKCQIRKSWWRCGDMGGRFQAIYVENELLGNKGKDILSGLSGLETSDDLLDGGKGSDKLIGHDGDDFLIGAAGNDILKGGDGNDIISGGKGRDTIKGGIGANIYEDEADGFVDKLYLERDPGNTRRKSSKYVDKIVELDFFDQIFVEGFKTEDLKFKMAWAGYQKNQGPYDLKDSFYGIGIYAGRSLEAVYIGNLDIDQIATMTRGTL